MQAAVLRKPRKGLRILEVELAPPREREVLVKIAACGVCASDLHVVDGDLPQRLPLVLGHEASGTVVETGPGIERLRQGDHVVLALAPSCGECAACRAGSNFCDLFAQTGAAGMLADGTSRLSLDGTELHHFNSISSFAEFAVVPESAAVAIPEDVPLDVAALVGCAVITGYGAVFNTAGVEEGSSVAVWGCGGVGLNVVQAARLAGARQIIAVDTRPEKLEAARKLGATDVVPAGQVDVVTAVRDLSDGGVDYAFEAIGLERTVAEAWDSARAGGTAVVLGLLPKGKSLRINPWWFIYEKTLRGSFLGSARIQSDIPRIIERYRSGELELDALVSHRIPLAELPGAFDRLRAGNAVRQLVIF